MLKIGIIGVGNIGRQIIKAVNDKMAEFDIIAVFDISKENLNRAVELINRPIYATQDFGKFISRNTDLIVESASQKAVNNYAAKVLSSKKNLTIMSVGALVDSDLLEKIMKIAETNNLKVFIPSGAIGGIDALRSANIDNIESVRLTTTKPPENLGIKEKLNQKIVIYKGSARDAVKKFPKNINVVATLSLAGIGFDRTMVKIVADPNIEANIHKINIKGSFGDMGFEFRNLPSPENPRTSYLAALSIIAALKNMQSNICIGV